MKSSIFRAYDIRGVYGEDITEKTMEIIGNSLGRFLEDKKVVLGRDPRRSGEKLSAAFSGGFMKTGKDVADVGMVPLGVGSLYAWRRKLPFAYITASHLTREWNGVKFFRKDAVGFLEEDNNKVRDLSLEGRVVETGRGKTERVDTDGAVEDYVNFLLSKIRPKRRLSVVIDCGNGAAGLVARRLFERAGFGVEMVFEEPDGDFPNRSPDNFEDPLREVRRSVKKAEIGIAYDGDGDRAVIIDSNGVSLTPEQTSYIILSDLLKEQKGPVVANVECTRGIDMIAEQFRREVKRVRVGHTFLMNSVKKWKASFGVESSGHYVIPSIFPADDSLAVSYYFACVLSGKGENLSDMARRVPSYPFRRVNFDCDDDKKFLVIERLREKMKSGFSNVNTIDGVRVDLDDGWVLIRASNTSPAIRLTVEGKNEKTFRNIRDRFSVMLNEAINSVKQ